MNVLSIGRTLLVLLGLFSGTLTTEAVLRVLYGRPDAPDLAYFRTIFDERPSPLMYAFRPGLDARYYGAALRTNVFGMREEEISGKASKRILVLGDSFAAGAGVAEEDVFSRQLRRRLLERGPASSGGIAVWNGAVHGYNTLQEAAWLRRHAFLKPTLVILVSFLNDSSQTRPLERLPRNEVFSGESPSLFHRARKTAIFAFLRNRRPVLFARLENLIYGKDYYHRLWDPALNRRGLAEFDRALSMLEEDQKTLGCDILAVIFPYITPVKPYPYGTVHSQMRARFERHGFPVLDLTDILSGRDADALMISPLNSHPSAEAHRLAAIRVADYLTAAGTGTNRPPS